MGNVIEAPRNEESLRVKPRVVKVSFNLSEAQYEAIEGLAQRRGVTMTEVLRRAIKSETFLQDEADRGRHVLTEDSDGENRKEILMPI